jgi:hypothetical protein
MSKRDYDKKKGIPFPLEEIHVPDKEEVRGKRDPNKKKKKNRDKDDYYDSNWN